MWFIRNIWYVFLGLGGLMLIVGLGMGVQTMNFRQSASRAQGMVIGNQISTDSDGDATYHPEVEFQTADGRKHRFVGGTGTSPPSFKAGERVNVIYKDREPDSAGIDTFFQQFFGTVLISGMGLIFGSIGAIPLYLRARRRRLADWLKANGQPIQADLTGAQLITSMEMNGANPYRISAQWKSPATNRVYVFRSENLWFDPTPFLPASKTINVLIDPNNPRRHWVDTRFLPKLG
jgi:hypothetical protein